MNSRNYKGNDKHSSSTSYNFKINEGASTSRGVVHVDDQPPSCSTWSDEYAREVASISNAYENKEKKQYLRVKTPSQLGISNQLIHIDESDRKSNGSKRKWSPEVYCEDNGSNVIKREISKKEMYKDMVFFSVESRISMHKVNILCLLAYGNRINSIINDDFLMAAMLSLVPQPLLPSGPIDSDYFLDLVEWYRCLFVLSNIRLEENLEYRNFETVFQTRRVVCLRDYIMIFVAMLRALGFQARFVMSLQPYPINVDDFERDSSGDEDSDNPTERKGKSKKGRVIAKGKGKAVLRKNCTPNRYYNVLPADRLEREKLVLKKYRTVLVKAIKRKNVKLDHWIEVYVKKEKQWMSVNIIHQTVDDIDSIYENLTSPLKYCLAWGNDDTIQEVTKLYAPDWYRGTSTRRCEKQWIDSTFAIFGKQSANRCRVEIK